MHLTPADSEKLLLAVAGMVARDRHARGVRLNYPEAVALISAAVMEGARDGKSVAALMSEGRAVLTRDAEAGQVHWGVPARPVRPVPPEQRRDGGG